jgi:glycosyltransferase involved in cell wall biosynthesis
MSKIALVHDYFTQQGGAERVAEELYHSLPGADLFATVAVAGRVPLSLADVPMRTSWMRHLPAMQRLHRFYFPFYPLGVASLDLAKYDLVVSSSSGYAKGVRTRSNATHVCYCHTPTRWIWRYQDYARRELFGAPERLLLPPLLKGLKIWDESAARQPDQFIANSQAVAERIWDVYRRRAVVIHPPIDVERFALSSEHDGSYLILSRLVSYKRIDLAIEACNRMQRRLIVIGDGPDRRRLAALAGPTVSLLGRLSDREVETYVAKCRALLFPGEEDFGMAPLEVAAAGKPTIAYRGGGALETIEPGVTGVLFSTQDAAGVASGIEDLEGRTWSSAVLRRHAQLFDKAVFRRRVRELLESMGLDLGFPPASQETALAREAAAGYL